ncbi:MAG: hypothetical protein V1899_05085 [Planctomycetota bacterium]
MLLAAAGLCHDLGKWLERGGFPLREAVSLDHVFCPSHHGHGYSHKHVLWTYEAALQTIAPFLVQAGLQSLKADAFACLAARHHAPQMRDTATALVCPVEEYILQQADWCSSGVDRMPDDEGRADRRDTTLLLPLFSEIALDKPKPAVDLRYALRRLAGDASSDPVSASVAGHGQSQSKAYAALWESFVNNLKSATQPANLTQAVDLLDGLMARYTWCIPSATNAMPDVPLYDHHRSVAALAETLGRYYTATGGQADEKTVTSDPKRPRLLLVGGDLTGIQAYIFRSRVAKGQARQLRARSFLLTALTRAIATLLLQRLDLPHVCLISEAGGRFQFLAPFTPAAEKALTFEKKEIAESLLSDFLGEITCNIAWVPMAISDFKPDEYQGRALQLSVELEAAKARPLTRSADGWRQDRFVRDFPRVDLEDSEILSSEDYGPRPGRRVLDDLGRQLVRCSHLALINSATDDQSLGKTTFPPFPLLGGKLHATLFHDCPDRLATSWLRAESYAGDAARLPLRPIANHVPHWTEDLMREIPEDRWRDADMDNPATIGDVMPFNAIAASGVRDGLGRPLLAVLKADVDRLGQVFSEGLREKMTLARYAGLSRMLDHFFGSRLMHILQTEFPLVYTVYAGGDDLMLVGPWRNMLGLAKRLREAFARYTGSNPNVTLSAAVVLVSPRLPIRRAADIADDDLEQAKRAGRNSITVFGRTLTWDEYCAPKPKSSDDIGAWSALEQGEWLAQRFSGKDAPPMSFLRQLLRFARLAEKMDVAQAAGSVVDIKLFLWLAHYHYQLGRNLAPRLAENTGSEWKSSAEGQFWVSLGEVPQGGERSRMARLAVPAEYALHCLRKI